MSGDLSLLILGSAMVLLGAAIVVWANAIAKFNRDQVSRLTQQKRYWWFWSDKGRVKFMGFAGVVLGTMVIVVYLQQILTGGSLLSP